MWNLCADIPRMSSKICYSNNIIGFNFIQLWCFNYWGSVISNLINYFFLLIFYLIFCLF